MGGKEETRGHFCAIKLTTFAERAYSVYDDPNLNQEQP